MKKMKEKENNVHVLQTIQKKSGKIKNREILAKTKLIIARGISLFLIFPLLSLLTLTGH